MQAKTIGGLVIGGVTGLALVCTLLGSWYTIDETERGVLLRNGAFVEVVEPGLHFKMPFINSVKEVSVQSQASRFTKLQAYSRDQQTAGLDVSISWHVPPTEVGNVYKQYVDNQSVLDRLIARQVPQQVENTFGQYTAVEAVQNRVKFVADVSKAIKDSIKGPVVIDSIQVENIDFSDDYEKSIALRMKAEVEVKTREQQLRTEQVQAQIRVTQAQAEADSTIAKAKAEAESTRLRGNADADAIQAKAKALASNQNLVELTKAERWNGILPTTVVPNGALPFIDVK